VRTADPNDSPLGYLLPYGYAHGDPIAFVDPAGEFEFSILGLTISVNIQGNVRTIEGNAKGASVRKIQGELTQLGSRSYREARALQAAGRLPKVDPLTGEKLEVHHLFEKRLLTYGKNGLQGMYKSEGDIPAILLTRTQHNLITKAWRELIPRRRMKGFFEPNLEQIVDAAAKVYAGNPVALKQVLLTLIL
jgi:hypothetical protein